MSEQLSEHFSLDEFIISQTASRLHIDNTPSPSIVARLGIVAAQLESVRSVLGDRPIHISSGYRSPKLNAAVGGVPTSAHTEGWAVDFICPAFGTPREVAQAIAASNIMFDQVIQEGTWCHISFRTPARHQVLTAHFGAGKTTYTEGLGDV